MLSTDSVRLFRPTAVSRIRRKSADQAEIRLLRCSSNWNGWNGSVHKAQTEWDNEKRARQLVDPSEARQEPKLRPRVRLRPRLPANHHLCSLWARRTTDVFPSSKQPNQSATSVQGMPTGSTVSAACDCLRWAVLYRPFLRRDWSQLDVRECAETADADFDTAPTQTAGASADLPASSNVPMPIPTRHCVPKRRGTGSIRGTVMHTVPPDGGGCRRQDLEWMRRSCDRTLLHD